MIKSKWIYCTILLVFCCAAFSSCGKKEHKVYRVGIISGAEFFDDMADGFREQMTKLGYIEGRNIVYDMKNSSIDVAAEHRILNKFVEDKVDLIFAFPTEPAVVAKEAVSGTNIPVVFGFAGLESGDLVEDIRRPGGNITGVRFTGPVSTARRLEILHELAPNAKRIGLIYDKGYPNAEPTLGALYPAAKSIGVTLTEVPVSSLAELEVALQKLSASSDIGMDAILIMPDTINHTPEGFGAIMKFANEHKIPVGGGQASQADIGALFGYSPYNKEIGILAAPIADKILKGTPAGEIPVVTPENHLRLNYKTAMQFGLTIPEGLLSIADEIIR